MSRGRLRIYLGAAPGVGKTFAMLNEGRRRAERGTDVVVGLVETHGRAATTDQIGPLEVMGRRHLDHRGASLEELDVTALLAQRPAVALVDELAHTNAPGLAHEKRWQDIEELLEAGIDVISTVNVQHLESLNDVIERITGIRQGETVPDWVVRGADQVELVDMTPEALRRRLAHGNVYAADKVDAALSNYFRVGNLSALRELALLWVADEVDEALRRYMDDHAIDGTWETRERVVVAVTGAPAGERLVRRAARMAQRTHGDLFGVHIRSGDGLDHGAQGSLQDARRLLGDLGGAYHEVVSSDVADGLVSFARSVKATQLVLGSTQRSHRSQLLTGSIINRVVRRSGAIDVHVISQDATRSAGPLPLPARRRRSPLTTRRQVAGWALGVIGLPTLTAVLRVWHDETALATSLLLCLLLVCTVAAVGGLRPALVTAVAGGLTTNWFFTEPYGTFRIDDVEQLIAVGVLVVAGVLVSVLVGQAARHSTEARRARAEAEALAVAAGTLSSERDPLDAMLAHVRTTFDQDAAAILRAGPGGTWVSEAHDGDAAPQQPKEGASVEIGPGRMLCLVPGALTADDRRVLGAFVARIGDALERRALEGAAAEAAARAHADELRTAILRAVSHDLRSPLASIKASATSLLQDDVQWSAAHRQDFALTIDEEADRLDRLISDLLDMSRIEAGAVEATARPVGLEDVIAAALDSLSQSTERVEVQVPDDLPAAVADASLFERVVANLVANALEHGPPDQPVRVEAATIGDHAVLRIVDRGPGIPADARDRVFDPFQRLGDGTPGGVGLGLAVAQGFLEAMDGGLSFEDTPGGGLTTVLRLPRAAALPSGPPSQLGATR